MFNTRSSEPERIDTGDYTEQEYRTFLREIRFINRWIGDRRALKKSLLRKIDELDVKDFSVLDVGAGSGEILAETAAFARKRNSRAFLVGVDLNQMAVDSIAAAGKDLNEILAVRGDALNLPFADEAFDFSICSLFTHHFTDEGVVEILGEMRRVSRQGIYVIDLHREPGAYRMYKLFCAVFRISTLVREDGLLSIKKAFQPNELIDLAKRAGLNSADAYTIFPARVVLRSSKDGRTHF
ncbi:MAG: methyltransferase domain-containing protein [Acidobacteriota bacterium]